MSRLHLYVVFTACLFASSALAAIADILVQPASVVQAGLGGVGVLGSDPLAASVHPSVMPDGRAPAEVEIAGMAGADGQLVGSALGACAAVLPEVAVRILAIGYRVAFDEIDANRDQTGRTLTAQSFSFGVGVSAERGSYAAGMNVRCVEDSVEGAGVTVPALDIGVSADWGQVGAAISIQGLNDGSLGVHREERVLGMVRAGMAAYVAEDRLRLGLELGWPTAGLARGTWGAEWQPMRGLALRAGMGDIVSPLTRPTFGLGVVRGRYAVDFSVSGNAIGPQVLAGFRLALGRMREPG
jgi:hypothetical protein